MKSHNKLSIIIPHYNSSDLLEKLLLTIPKGKNIEVIVIDDKSDDKHIKYLKRLSSSDKYIDFIFLNNETLQKGAGVARNIGLDRANGEWILFADSDDYFSDNFYENVSEYFGSDNDVVFFKSTSIYLDTEEEADRHVYIKNILDNYLNRPNLPSELDLRYSLFVPWGKIIKKDMILKNDIRFDETLVSNDVMFSTKVGFYMDKFQVVDQVIYVVTKNKGSLTTNMSESVFDMRFDTILRFTSFLKENLRQDEIKLLNLSRYGRGYLLRSRKYGLVKSLSVLYVLYKNGIGFFHYKLLNPFHIVSRIKRYKEKSNIDSKYTVSND